MVRKFRERPAKRYLTVRRKGFTIKKGPRKGTRVSPATFRIRDVGAPGRGPRVIPPLRKGAMTTVAREMGYASPTQVPDDKIDEFVDRLVKRYGERRAFGMVQAQRTFRKRFRDHSKEKFDRMMAEWRKGYAGEGWG